MVMTRRSWWIGVLLIVTAVMPLALAACQAGQSTEPVPTGGG